MQFRSPKKVPERTKGYLVIQSDDCNAGDWLWYNKLKRLERKYTQFVRDDLLKLDVNINSGVLANKLTLPKLKIMYDDGVRVNNHCKYHISLGKHILSANASQGAASISLYDFWETGIWNLPANNTTYHYIITDGTNSEIITPQPGTANPISITETLQHSYSTAGTTVSLTAESIALLVNDCADYLENQGIEVDGFVYPFHAATMQYVNPDAQTFVNGEYSICRGNENESAPYNVPDSINWHDLTSFAIRPNDNLTTKKASIDTYLTATKNNGYLTIVYGHGETDAVTQELLEYVVDQAISKGIAIVHMKEAYEILS